MDLQIHCDIYHHIRANGRTVAIYSRGSNGANNTIYPLNDHLGSTDAVTNSSGTIIVKESFSAFGARRNGASWSGAPTGTDMTAIGDATRRGYTEHSMLDNIGLVHMNGRVMDPVLGRFLSPDPTIDCALTTVGWNRYVYVANNPLSLVDPSGTTRSRRDLPMECDDEGNNCTVMATATAAREVDATSATSGRIGGGSGVGNPGGGSGSSPAAPLEPTEAEPTPDPDLLERRRATCMADCMTKWHVLAGAVGGAIAGSTGGVWGAGIGAVVGLAGGLAASAGDYASALGSDASGAALRGTLTGSAAAVGAAVGGAGLGRSMASGAAAAIPVASVGVGVEAGIAGANARGYGGLTGLTPGARGILNRIATGLGVGGVAAVGLIANFAITDHGEGKCTAECAR